ncbi:tRNA (Uracil-5-)-methyltransferase TRM9 [Paraphaeosphaeria sporulosa]
MTDAEQQGAAYEEEHVHAVYEQIASHFSATRYKPWPIIERFLKELPDGAVGADVGCGNGKYLTVNPRVFMVASDRYVDTRRISTNLVKIAKQHQPHDGIVADIMNLPHPKHSFDFAISIAVIHHISTPERRIEAVKAILELLRPPSAEKPGSGGRALIYVWALEQKDSRRGWDEGNEQDVMVPWVMRAKKEKEGKKGKGKDQKATELSNEADQPLEQPQDKTFLRYYHLYRKGELEQIIGEAGGEVVEAGYDKDNWWAIATRQS